MGIHPLGDPPGQSEPKITPAEIYDLLYPAADPGWKYERSPLDPEFPPITYFRNFEEELKEMDRADQSPVRSRKLPSPTNPNPLGLTVPSISAPAVQEEVKPIHKPMRVYSSINPIASAKALEDVWDRLKKHLVLKSEHHFIAQTLWIAATHFLPWNGDFAPRLGIWSPEKRCGKSLNLEIVSHLSARPIRTSDISPAALFRIISKDEQPPTIFIDESDAIFGGEGNGEKAEALRSIANSGFKRGQAAIRMGGKAMDEVKEFPTFAPLALAGIGTSAIPETVADRSIMIEMRRKQPGEDIEEFESDEIDEIFTPLRMELEAMARSRGSELRKIQVEKISELNARARDKWKPLLRIATLAGPDWLEMARTAAIALDGGEEDLGEQSENLRLLSDVRGVFNVPQMSSKGLCQALTNDEESEWIYRPGFNQYFLSRLLKQYGIRTRALSTGVERGKRGYLRADFQDAWERYLAVLPIPEKDATSPTGATD